MASANKSVFEDVPQGLLFYAASLGFAAVLLFGISSVIVGLTDTNIAYLSAGAGVWLVFGTVYRVRGNRKRRENTR